MSDDKETIEQVLENMPNGIGFDDLAAEEASPLNEPVAEGEIGVAVEQQPPASPTVKDVPYTKADEGDDPEPVVPEPPPSAADFEADTSEAPEQPLDEMPDKERGGASASSASQSPIGTGGAGMELPEEHAGLMADAFMGITDNVLTFAGGFFIKFKQRKEFLEFEGFQERIDKANARHEELLKLDDSERAMIRPLLIQVLQRKGQKLTPEHALIGAGITILMKKIQAVLQIRADIQLMEQEMLKQVQTLKATQDKQQQIIDELMQRIQSMEKAGQGNTGPAPDAEAQTSEDPASDQAA